MSTYLGTQLLAGVATDTISNGHSLLDFKWTDHILNELSWLRADTFSWQNGAVYVAAYNHLVADASGTAQTETIGSYTITYYKANDGHKIVLANQEQTVTNIYNESGVAWYYILDTTNTRFKLPRTKWGFTGIRDVVGNFVRAGLPNITGCVGGVDRVGSGQSGAFYTNGTGTFGSGGTTSNNREDIKFDASRSNSLYGVSNTVQPQATQMYLYFYVGDYTQSAIEQTAGLNLTLFNNKVDLDGTNATFPHIIDKQDPTSSNNYTWYRKYSDGWVEQGGIITSYSTGGWQSAKVINLPVEMSNNKYVLTWLNGWVGNTDTSTSVQAKATTSFTISTFTSYNENASASWEVKGIAA